MCRYSHRPSATVHLKHTHTHTNTDSHTLYVCIIIMRSAQKPLWLVLQAPIFFCPPLFSVHFFFSPRCTMECKFLRDWNEPIINIVERFFFVAHMCAFWIFSDICWRRWWWSLHAFPHFFFCFVCSLPNEKIKTLAEKKNSNYRLLTNANALCLFLPSMCPLSIRTNISGALQRCVSSNQCSHSTSSADRMKKKNWYEIYRLKLTWILLLCHSPFSVFFASQVVRCLIEMQWIFA